MPNPPPSPLALLGAGRMGGALLRGWLKQDAKTQFIILDPHIRLDDLTAQLSDAQIAQLVFNPDYTRLKALAPQMIVVAVKPQNARAILREIMPHLPPSVPLISMMAGVRLRLLAKWCGAGRLYVRVMPNIAALVRHSMSVAIASDACEHEAITHLLAAVGEVAWAKHEDDMDAVTALSGSGPGFVFEFIAKMPLQDLEQDILPAIVKTAKLLRDDYNAAKGSNNTLESNIITLVEQMTSGGISDGSERDLAQKLAIQTIIGITEMLIADYAQAESDIKSGFFHE